MVGALFVAFFLAVETGVIGGVGAEEGTAAAMTYERLAGIAETKALEESSYQVLAMFFPIMAFVAMGFDHVVANMFCLPAAIFAGMPDLGWDDVLRNWTFAFLGNLVGAIVFVASSYWYLCLRDEPEDATRVG